MASWKLFAPTGRIMNSCMAATVDDVEGGDGQDDLLVSGQVSDVSVQRNSLLCSTGLAHSQGHALSARSTV